MKVIELTIDEFQLGDGVDCVALVEKPAIQQEFMAFSAVEPVEFSETELIDLFILQEMCGECVELTHTIEETPKYATQTFAAVDDQQIIVSPLMIPDKKMMRIDEKTKELYEAYFTADTIQKMAYKFMKDKLIDNINLEHDPNQPVKNAYLAESWIVQDPELDKAKFYGFSVPKGTWMVMYKVADKQIWTDYIKSGKVCGLSLEGMFAGKVVKQPTDI